MERVDGRHGGALEVSNRPKDTYALVKVMVDKLHELDYGFRRSATTECHVLREPESAEKFFTRPNSGKVSRSTVHGGIWKPSRRSMTSRCLIITFSGPTCTGWSLQLFIGRSASPPPPVLRLSCSYMVSSDRMPFTLSMAVSKFMSASLHTQFSTQSYQVNGGSNSPLGLAELCETCQRQRTARTWKGDFEGTQ